MGKKKQNRVVIDGYSRTLRKDKKIQKHKTSDHSLILSYKDKKTLITNFDLPNQRSLLRRQYINLNHDHKKYTPAFLYENQFKIGQKYQENYQAKLKAAKQQIQQPAKPPQPREKKNRLGFCAVCKNSYQKYFDHTKSKEHVKKMKDNQFTRGLKKIETFYEFKRERRARIRKMGGYQNKEKDKESKQVKQSK